MFSVMLSVHMGKIPQNSYPVPYRIRWRVGNRMSKTGTHTKKRFVTVAVAILSRFEYVFMYYNFKFGDTVNQNIHWAEIPIY